MSFLSQGLLKNGGDCSTMGITQNLSSGLDEKQKVKNFRIEASAYTIEKDQATSLAYSPFINKKDYILENSHSQGSAESRRGNRQRNIMAKNNKEENISIMVLTKPHSTSNKPMMQINSMLRQGCKDKANMKKVRIVKANSKDRGNALEKSAQKGHKQVYKPPVIENQCFSAFSIQPSSKEMRTLAIQKGLKEKYGRVMNQKSSKVMTSVPNTPPIQSPHQSKENVVTHEVETLSKSLKVKPKQQNLDLPFSDHQTMKLQPDEVIKTSFTGQNSNKSSNRPEVAIKDSKGSNYIKYRNNPISNGTKELQQSPASMYEGNQVGFSDLEGHDPPMSKHSTSSKMRANHKKGLASGVQMIQNPEQIKVRKHEPSELKVMQRQIARHTPKTEMHYYTTPVIMRDLAEANSHTYFEKLEKPSKNPEYKQMI